jgi:hypothetical protein
VKTLSNEIERYPKFEIESLGKPPVGHKRHRRTKAEVAAAKAAKEERKTAHAKLASNLG